MMKRLCFTLYFAFILSNLEAQNSLVWSTYYGGSLYDVANCVATDDSGNVFLAGYTSSTSGIAAGGHQSVYGGGTYDAFLVKLDASGNRVWATYFGSNNNDYGHSLALDMDGNLYLAGGTSSISGIASGGFQSTYGGGSYDAFLAKFDPSGNLIWSTYYGGTGWEDAQSVDTDTLGNVYLAGFTNGLNGIASGGFQSTFGGGTYDSFLVKFDSSGNRIWATYYGGTGSEGYDCNSVATDHTGCVYLSGWTSSPGGIASNGFQNTIGGGNDVFLVKFDAAGNRLWATYYGGSGNDGGISNILGGRNVATDTNGNVYLSGTTQSTSAIAAGGFQNIYGGGAYDCFLAKFDSAGTRIWGTYYGGTDDERGWGVATDASDNVYLTGRSNSTLNIASGGFQNSISGMYDSFVVSFSPAGSRYCATYFGGPSVEWSFAPAVDSFGNLYLPGFTASTSGVATNGFQTIYGGGTYDAYLAKFASCTPSYIDEVSGTLFAVYPNPVSEWTTFTTSEWLDNATLSILNSLGQIVLQINNVYGNEIRLNTEILTNGYYFVRLEEHGKALIYTKIIVTNIH